VLLRRDLTLLVLLHVQILVNMGRRSETGRLDVRRKDRGDDNLWFKLNEAAAPARSVDEEIQ
jgi:hypothetical protein